MAMIARYHEGHPDLGCPPAQEALPPQSHSSHGARLLGCWAICTPKPISQRLRAALGGWRWGGRKFLATCTSPCRERDSGSPRAKLRPGSEGLAVGSEGTWQGWGGGELVCPQTMKGIQDDMGRAPAASAIHLWVGRHLLMESE